MFATNDNRLAASEAAGMQMKLISSCVAFRVRLQRLLDTANKIPVYSSQPQPTAILEHASSSSLVLKSMCLSLSDMLDDQSSLSDTKKRQRSTSINDEDDVDAIWTHINDTTSSMKPHWGDVIDKFHARAYFGSEKKKSKLKSFHQSTWDQIDVALADERTVRDKTTMPLHESTRVDKPTATSHSNIASIDGERSRTVIEHDAEVYDDRIFYSNLIKSFASSLSSGENDMLPDADLRALRLARKQKLNVDRKASKGRKIRYIAHVKLQNFMFPVHAPAPQLDVDRLYQSLFQ